MELSLSQLRSSSYDNDSAKRTLQHLFESSNCKSVSECTRIKEDMFKLRSLLYAEILSVEDTLHCLAYKVIIALALYAYIYLSSQVKEKKYSVKQNFFKPKKLQYVFMRERTAD